MSDNASLRILRRIRENWPTRNEDKTRNRNFNNKDQPKYLNHRVCLNNHSRWLCISHNKHSPLSSLWWICSIRLLSSNIWWFLSQVFSNKLSSTCRRCIKVSPNNFTTTWICLTRPFSNTSNFCCNRILSLNNSSNPWWTQSLRCLLSWTRTLEGCQADASQPSPMMKAMNLQAIAPMKATPMRMTRERSSSTQTWTFGKRSD